MVLPTIHAAHLNRTWSMDLDDTVGPDFQILGQNPGCFGGRGLNGVVAEGFREAVAYIYFQIRWSHPVASGTQTQLFVWRESTGDVYILHQECY